MYPILFSIGKINIYTHGLLIAIGILFGGYIIFYLAKKAQLSRKFLFNLLVYSLFAGIIGARIAYVMLYYYQFSNWHEMFFIWYGGLVSFGGIILGFLAAGIILKKHHQNILQWFDIGMIGLLFAWTFGRIGCLLTGDVPGVGSSVWPAIWGHIPVALFEAIWSFVLGGILFYLLCFKKEFVSKLGSGILFFGGLAGYTLGRFIIDFWRQEPVFFILKGGQIVSLIIFLAVVTILLIYYFRLPAILKNNKLFSRKEI